MYLLKMDSNLKETVTRTCDLLLRNSAVGRGALSSLRLTARLVDLMRDDCIYQTCSSQS